MRIGLISDTHGLLRPQVLERLADVDLILHAGDIGPEDIVTELEVLAPVKAVHGNTDGLAIRARYPEVQEMEEVGRRIVVTHGHVYGSPTPAVLRNAFPAADVIVFGHTHRPEIDRAEGRLVINPGAAGPARFRLSPSVAVLRLDSSTAEVEEIPLTD